MKHTPEYVYTPAVGCDNLVCILIVSFWCLEDGAVWCGAACCKICPNTSTACVFLLFGDLVFIMFAIRLQQYCMCSNGALVDDLEGRSVIDIPP